jgi:hypothetical protein
VVSRRCDKFSLVFGDIFELAHDLQVHSPSATWGIYPVSANFSFSVCEPEPVACIAVVRVNSDSPVPGIFGADHVFVIRTFFISATPSYGDFFAHLRIHGASRFLVKFALSLPNWNTITISIFCVIVEERPTFFVRAT